MEPRRVLALYDMHFGWERRMRGGVWKTEPTHDLQSVATAIQFAKEFKPHVVVLGGDQLNCGPISHWNGGRPILVEGLRLQKEYDLFKKHVLDPLDAIVPPRRSGGEKHWINGNHEEWIHAHVEVNPSLEGLVEPENYLRLRQRGWKVYSSDEIVKVGKLNYMHGNSIFGKGSASGAKKMVAYKRNMRCGHIHTYEVYSDVMPSDTKDFHTVMVIPALSNLSPAYMKGRPSNHLKGFSFGWLFPDGTFSDYVAIINKGRFIWNGRVYGKQ